MSHPLSYKDMDRPHSMVHESIVKNIEIVKDDPNAIIYRKKDIINNFKTMEAASEELLNVMDRLVSERRELISKNESKNRD